MQHFVKKTSLFYLVSHLLKSKRYLNHTENLLKLLWEFIYLLTYIHGQVKKLEPKQKIGQANISEQVIQHLKVHNQLSEKVSSASTKTTSEKYIDETCNESIRKLHDWRQAAVPKITWDKDFFFFWGGGSLA